MPQQNYRQAKKQKEQTRKARKEEKQRKRIARQADPAGELAPEPQGSSAAELTQGEGT